MPLTRLEAESVDLADPLALWGTEAADPGRTWTPVAFRARPIVIPF